VGLTPLSVETEYETGTDPAAAFRSAVEKRNSSLAASLDDVSVRVSGRTVTLVVDPPNASLERRLAEPGLGRTLEEAAVAALGRGATVRLEPAMPTGGDLSAEAASADPKALEKQHLRKKAEGDEKVRKALDLFGGAIVDVRKDEGDPS